MTFLRRRFVRIALVGLTVASAAVAFGLGGDDAAAVRTFNGAVDRWQHAPEFRAVAVAYAALGSRAVRARPLFLSGPRIVMALRSTPFLPARLAANPTSAAHYAHFNAGPLCAYLYLCDEQSVAQFAGVLRDASRHDDPGLLLGAFHTPYPVCRDAGAYDSVRSLIRDLGPQRLPGNADRVAGLLLPHVRAIARRLGVPADPAAMTPDQQQAVLDRLDAEVRLADPSLWRVKQLTDFCAGVWAQMYGPPYQLITRPVLLLHQAGQFLLPLLLALLVATRPPRRAGQAR